MEYPERNPKRRPFLAFPDVESYYPSAAAEEARRQIFRSLDRGEGVSLLFGEAGVGKSLLMNLLADGFELNAPVLRLTGFRFPDRKSFLARILFELKLDSTGTEDDVRLRLLDFFRRSEYSRFFLFLDDAERLPLFTFDELRTLLDLTTGQDVRVRVALSGTSQLEERLNHPKLTRFTQRIVVRQWLEPFSRKETAAYIDACTAACHVVSFTADAKARIHQYSEGIPRIINQIADLALWLGPTAGKEQEKIDEYVIDRSWKSLQQIPDSDPSPEPEKRGTRVKISDEDASGYSAPSQEIVPQYEETDPLPHPSVGYEGESVVEFGSLSDDTPNEEASETEPTLLHFPTLTSAPSREDGAFTASLRSRIQPSADEQETDGSDAASESSVRNFRIQTTPESLEYGEIEDEEEEYSEEEDELEENPEIDSEMDRRIRQRLLGDSVAPSSQSNTAPKESQSIRETVEATPPRFIPGKNDSQERRSAYLEELRLLELEVEQEVSLIRKIREMQSGLNSFRFPEESRNDQNTDNQQPQHD